MPIKTVTIGTSDHGYNQPEIKLQFPTNTYYRTISAAIYQVAAEIELSTPSDRGWVVVADPSNRRVYLELLSSDPSEINSAMSILKKIAS